MNEFHLTTLDLSIILGVTLAIALIGLLAARKVERTAKGYFLMLFFIFTDYRKKLLQNYY